jgi:PRTRC genetic system ParB family protein
MNAETDTDTTLTQSLPLASIVVAPDHNPRKHFNTAEFDRLVESIRENGLLTPVLVRPNPNGEGYELIAGERRLRAMRALGADTIPALIKDLDDTDAARAALIENLDRSALSVAEESLAAQSHVSAYDGDYEAAAKALGWGVQKLRHRLRLLHCAPEVMRSLMEEQITLGHAELLATVPVENQLKALPRVLANNIGVTELREQLNGFATPLAQAIFDQAVSGCATCEFNSATQRSLFSTHLDNDMCTNRACFTGHTQTALQAKRDKLKEDFGTVALHSERVPGSTIPLVVHGESGVGAEQFSVCRGCQFRGAVIQDAVGPQTGKVDHPLCFNRACHSSKVDAHQQSLKPVVEASDAQPSRPDVALPSDTTKVTSPSKPNPGASKASPAKPAAAKATPGAVADQYAAILRRAVTARLQTDPVTVLSLALYALLRVTGDEGHAAWDRAGGEGARLAGVQDPQQHRQAERGAHGVAVARQAGAAAGHRRREPASAGGQRRRNRVGVQRQVASSCSRGEPGRAPRARPATLRADHDGIFVRTYEGGDRANPRRKRVQCVADRAGRG